MSTELIGNGNFPCVYTENIVAREAERVIKIDCKIPEMKTSDGLYLWSDVELVQNSNIKLYSLVVYNRIGELSQFINDHNQNNVTLQQLGPTSTSPIQSSSPSTFESSSETPFGSPLRSPFGSPLGSPFGSPLGSPFGSPLESSLESPLYTQSIPTSVATSARSISLNQILGLQQRISPVIPDFLPENTSFFYEHSFEHDQIDFNQDNIYILTFISYNIEIDSNTNILPRPYDFFGGPVNVDIVKEAGKYKLSSQIFYSSGELYKGAIHKMGNGAMAGAVHYEDGEILVEENNSYNPKLFIIRDYDAYSNRSLYISTPQQNQYSAAISKPMWSFYYDEQSNHARVRCIFKIDSINLTPFSLGPLASYNYKKIKDKMTVSLKIGNELLDITSPLRKIKINHGDSSTNGQEFFEIEAEIPNNYVLESVELLINVPLITLSASDIIDLLCNNPASIKSNFLLGSNIQHDKEFIKKFLLLFSVNKNINFSDLQIEKNILLNNISGQATQEYRDSMVQLFTTQYDDVVKKLQPLVSNEELFSKSFVSNPRNFVRIRNNYYPQYFDQSGQPQQGAHLVTGNGKNYITIIDLQKRLLEESNRVVDRSQQIVTGNQQLQPWKILNKGIKNFEDIVTVPDLQTKLGWYANDGTTLYIGTYPNFTNNSEDSDMILTEENDAIITQDDDRRITERDLTILRRNTNFNIGY